MKKKILFLFALMFAINISFAQYRNIARGAMPGELYLSHFWYQSYNESDPSDTVRVALYRITENGKKIAIQYDADYYAHIDSVMQPMVILADATPGVVYNIFQKNYPLACLWVSFDYGKSWVLREENIGIDYYVANVEGLIYRRGYNGTFKSEDYGSTFSKIETSAPGSEPGLQFGEAYGISTNGSKGKLLLHTYNFYETYSTTPIDSQYVFGQVWGVFPDVYRGGLPGEVYVSSMFPDDTYKVSFSADTGHTFRHVYVSNVLTIYDYILIFMSDREPGVFYIIHSYEVKDTNPWGWHTKICIEYYRDYGETLVATYCHDITKDYNNGVEVKEVKKLEEIVLYPNPAFTTVTVEIASQARNDVSRVEIYNTVGQLLQIATTKTVNVSSYNAGIYFFKVFDTDNNSVTKRVVVVR